MISKPDAKKKKKELVQNQWYDQKTQTAWLHSSGRVPLIVD